MSFGEPIALRVRAELERAADAAASVEDRFQASAEAQFLERLKAGDAMAFNRLVEERHSDIYALLYRLTEDAEEARDLTQETFLQAFRHLAGFRGDADLRTWLYRIAVNQARNRWRWWKRRRRDRTVSLDAPAGSESETPLSAGIRDEDACDGDQGLRRRPVAVAGDAHQPRARLHQEVVAGQMAVRLTRPGDKDAVFSVAESDFSRRRQDGTLPEISVQLLSNPDITAHGKVREIAPVAP